MNGKTVKKLRQLTNRKIRYDIDSTLRDLCSASLKYRIVVAFRIIFKHKVLINPDK